jgi:ABC-type transport system involved in multi-copper enzyme maturation permease subunit
MFWNILRMEGGKTLKRPFFWLSLLIIAVLIAFFYGMFFIFRANVPKSAAAILYWPFGLIYGLDSVVGYTPYTSYGAFLLIVLIGVVTGQEYQWRTLQLWLSHGVPRSALLSAKFLFMLLPACIIVAVCMLVNGGESLVFSSLAHIPSRTLDGGQLVLSYLRTLYATLPYIALTFLLIVMGRSTAFAVGAGIAGLAIVETVLSLIFPIFGAPFARVVQFLPSSLAAALNTHNYALASAAIPHTPLQATTVQAVLGIACYVVLFTGLAFWRFQRQDLAN